MTEIHNHGSEEGPSLSCHERRIDGKLIGECMTNQDECDSHSWTHMYDEGPLLICDNCYADHPNNPPRP